MFIDTHVHLDARYHRLSPEKIVARAFDAGVSQMLVVGCGLDASREAVELSSKHPGSLFAVVGVHPHDSGAMTSAEFDEIARLAERGEVVGVGETGLDYHYDHSPRDVQRDVFRRFLRLAAAVEKPFVVHTREAEEDTLSILEEEAPFGHAGELHCFTGTSRLAWAAISMGLHISFSGAVTFANAESLRQTASEIPLDKLLVETDSPFMTPAPFRGEKNEPMFVPAVAGALAAVKGLSIFDLAERTSRTARALFALPRPPRLREAPALAFPVGHELYAYVGESGEKPSAVVEAARRYPLRRIRAVVPFTAYDAGPEEPVLRAVSSFARELGATLGGVVHLPKTTETTDL